MIECCFQMLRFTPWIGALNGLLMIHFIYSWYSSAKKTGWKIDFWFFNLFLLYIINTGILYPFSASIYHIPATIGYYHKIIEWVDRAFFINLLGYACLWIGRYLFDRTTDHSVLKKILAFFDPFCSLIEENIKNKKVVFVLSVISLLLGSWLFAFQFKTGEFFKLRSYFLKQEGLRPVFNFIITLFPIATSYLSLRYLHFKEKQGLFFFLLLTFFSFFFGMRAVAIFSLLFFLSYRVYLQKGTFRWKPFFLSTLGIFALTLYIDLLRQGVANPTPLLMKMFFDFFYGNTFSDLRDFAWLLAFWDGELFYGKTYCAGLLSFIPRTLSPLRQEWGFSMITNEWIGFDLEEMPGLRPGIFGEAYFNFSYAGVILFGFLLGYILRFADTSIKETVSLEKDIIKGYARTFLFSFVLQLSVSTGLRTIYLFILVNIVLYSIRRIRFRSFS